MSGIIIIVDYHITRHAFDWRDINYEPNESITTDFYDDDFQIWFKIHQNIRLIVTNVMEDINQSIKDHLTINRYKSIPVSVKHSILKSLV